MDQGSFALHRKHLALLLVVAHIGVQAQAQQRDGLNIIINNTETLIKHEPLSIYHSLVRC